MIVLLLFFCSGATALVYEVIWSKYLSLLLGSTVQAQTVTLAAFMGGLALGNRLIGNRADRHQQPLVLYGYLEILIGVYAFAFDGLYRGADWFFVRTASGLLGQSALLLGMKAILGASLLILPTVLMGGTLPLLAAWLQQRFDDPGRRSARFYSVNSLGAVAGAALAGFFLIQCLGMIASLQATGLMNVLVGAIAIGMGRRAFHSLREPRRAAVASAPERVSAEGDDARPKRLFQAACLLVSFTGAVSMGLEVLSARSLVLIVGASAQAFATVLIAFIVGISAGSAMVASARFQRLPWFSLTTVLLLSAALWIGGLVIGIESWVTFYRQLHSGLARNETGYVFHSLLTTLLSLGILGVPAAMIGAVLPLSIRVCTTGGELGRAVGQLLTWNTIGAVAGSLATGFILMPGLGLRGAFFALVTLLCLAAATLAWTTQRRSVAALAMTVALALLGGGLLTGEGWRHTLSSGVFRFRETQVDPELMRARKKYVKLLYYKDAADATVTVESSLESTGLTNIALRVNGKPDASTITDLSTQVLCAHLPLLVQPDAQRVFVLGLGSGATAGAVLDYPVKEVVVAENCAPVIEAAKFFECINNGVLHDARIKIVRDDGRTVLKLSQQPFDAIISEPSNPWMVGVGGVFSQEFYQLCASRLTENGMMLQWFHVYEMSDAIVAMVLRTFNQAFPAMEVWDVNRGDVLLLGSRKPWATGPAAFQRAFTLPSVRRSMALIGIEHPEELLARQLASQQTAFAIAGPGGVQSDGFPVLEYAAPRAFYVGAAATSLLRFDERLSQVPLAPREKREALAALPEASLRRIFHKFQSTIPEFERHLQSHTDDRCSTNHHVGPCIFRPEEWARTPFDVQKNASPQERGLFQALGQLRQNDDTWQDGFLSVQALLTAQAASPGTNCTWSIEAVARDAATAALSHGRPELAANVIQTGLKLEPAAPTLLYLQRLLLAHASAAPTVAAAQPQARALHLP